MLDTALIVTASLDFDMARYLIGSEVEEVYTADQRKEKPAPYRNARLVKV